MYNTTFIMSDSDNNDDRDDNKINNNLGVVAVLQCCPTPRLFAGIRLHRLSIVPIC